MLGVNVFEQVQFVRYFKRHKDEGEHEIFISVFCSFSRVEPLHHFLQAGGGGAFDAAVGTALLSVVNLPDLSTVNRQG